MLVPASSNRSKNSCSLGTKTCDRRGMRASPGMGRVLGGRAAVSDGARSLVGAGTASGARHDAAALGPGPATGLHRVFTPASPGRNPIPRPPAEDRGPMEPVYDPVAAVIRAGPLEIRPVESLVIAGGTMRPGDRSVDVYVHKLRIKLEESLPDWRFVRTHVGFGYRFSSEPSHAF